MQKFKALSKAFVGLSVLGLFSTQVMANEAELSLNDDVVKIAGQFAMGGFDLEASLLHNQDRGNVFGLAGLLYGDAGAEGLNAGIGVKLAYVDTDIDRSVAIDPPIAIDSPSGAALAIGGKVQYVPADYNRFNARAYLWFAPDVLSFDKLTKYQEIGGDLGYNITRSADVFIGYRNIKGKFKEFGTGTLDTGLHFGIRGTF